MKTKTEKEQKKVVVAGAGFGGFNAVKRLLKDQNIRVTLIDRNNYHLFQPFLYQVAMAGLAPAHIAIPLRSIFKNSPNIEILMGEARKVDFRKNLLICDFGELEFDYLILACGAEYSYFGHDEWEIHAPTLKTIEQALEIRRRVLTAFEKAETERDLSRKKELLSFVVIGGGPTGIELAGALGEIKRLFFAGEYKNITPEEVRIYLIEAQDHLLADFSSENSQAAQRELSRLGVEVLMNSPVSEINEKGVMVGEELIPSQNVIWATGVIPNKINRNLGVALDSRNRLQAEPDLSLKNAPNVFAIGDQANYRRPDEQALPGMAPVAIQQGVWAAKNILRDIKGKPRIPFKFIDKGKMATIGRSNAIVETKIMKTRGFLGWLIWLFVHIYYIVGFKNRTDVMLQWIWSYLTYKKASRLIVGTAWQAKNEAKSPQCRDRK